ncbi:extracellular solute-binding protein [Paenibacillus sp. IB182496]|uniref:Extracellular solute-binding protein n=1 Tax=Paenibacillus sabuli TaxID=2772509 RepID=A0A927BX14_9BACL|nr:extracellular solute-binding protein [Paenibacillus sabuli]MBD2847180.1 extracellular solute-binding protein [Paenibacillus sabuli]
MSTWTKKAGLGLLAAALGTSLLAACSNGNNETPGGAEAEPGDNFNATGYPIVDEKETQHFVISKGPAHGDFDEMDTVQALEEMTNVHIQWEAISQSGFDEKKNLMFASGELPDGFFLGLNSQDVIQYGQQGILLPLEDLIEQYAPNISRIFEDYPAVRQAATAPDGHIYALPWFEGYEYFLYRNTLLINKTWLDNLGLDVPETTEEFHEVLKAFKTQDPNGNGKADEMASTWLHNEATRGYYELFGAFGAVDAMDMFSIEDGKVRFEGVRDEYRDGLNYLHALYADGLIDPETFTQNADQLAAKTRTGNVGVLAAFTGIFELGEELLSEHYVAVPPLKGPNGDQLWRRQDNRLQQNFFSITSENPHPEVAIRLADAMNETDMRVQLHRGPFGTHLQRTDDGLIEPVDPPAGVNALEFKGQEAPLNSLPLLYPQEDLDLNKPDAPQRYRMEFYEIYKPYIVPEENYFPLTYIDEEKTRRLAILETDIMQYIRKMEAKWIIEGGADAEWDAYLKELGNMGLEEYIQIHQDVYDNLMSAQ